MKTKRNFWPVGIILLLLAFAGGITTLVVIASSSNAELVSDNYYEQAIQYQQRIDGTMRAHEAGASVRYDAETKRVVLSLGRGGITSDSPPRLELYRPNAADLDQTLPLVSNADGDQIADAKGLQPGLWKIRASWAVNGQAFWLEGNLTNRDGMTTKLPVR